MPTVCYLLGYVKDGKHFINNHVIFNITVRKTATPSLMQYKLQYELKYTGKYEVCRSAEHAVYTWSLQFAEVVQMLQPAGSSCFVGCLPQKLHVHTHQLKCLGELPICAHAKNMPVSIIEILHCTSHASCQQQCQTLYRCQSYSGWHSLPPVQDMKQVKPLQCGCACLQVLSLTTVPISIEQNATTLVGNLLHGAGHSNKSAKPQEIGPGTLFL